MKQCIILVNAYTQSEAELYQPNRMKAEFEKRGVKVELRRNFALPFADLSADFCLYYDKDKYCARNLESMGLRLFNSAKAIETCDDKMLTHLALEGFPMPKTTAAPLCYTDVPVSRAFLDEIEREFSYPLVAKECFGSLGKGVYKIENRTELEKIAERLKTKPHLFQEFIRTSEGTDVRAIVIGGEVVCAMKRTAQGFLSNLSAGGKGEPYFLDEKTKTMCEEIAKRLGLDYCGIDLLFGEEGFLVCEVNSNAFFAGVEKVAGVNVAERYAAHIMQEIYGENVEN